MKITKGLCAAFCLGLLLSACTPAATQATAQSPAPSSQPTPTVPQIEVGNLQLPDPRATNPELFDLNSPDAPIVQFANAFGVDPEEVVFQQPEIKTGVDGKQFVVMTTADLASTANFDETGIPLLMDKQGEDGEWKWSDVNLRTLIEKIDPSFEIGATAHYPVYGDEFNRPNLEEFLTTNFNSTILENHLRWNGLETNQGIMDQTRINQVNQLIDFAILNNQIILGQHLFYYYEYPDWLKNGSFTQEQLEKIMQDRANSIMKKFPQIITWVVANEFHPISLNYHEDFLQSKLGTKEALFVMFQAAQNANPNAMLLFSDSHNETMSETNFQRTLEFVSFLKESGIRNVGVGMHLHRNANSSLDQEAMKEAIKKLGVPVFITEADFDLTNISPNNQDRLFIQAEEFGKSLSACLSAENCRGFFIWNPGDSSSFLEQGSIDADPTPFDDNLNPKPAYYALLQALVEY